MVLAALCLSVATGCALHRGGSKAPEQADSGKIRVFVTTAATETVPSGDQVLRLRITGVLAEALSDKKTLALVKTRPQADVVVDVRSAASVFVPGTGSRFDDKLVLVDVTGGGESTRLAESGHDRTRTTKKVASDIERWVETNRSKIVAARAPAK